MNAKKISPELASKIQNLRREIHQSPELGNREKNTQKIIFRHLESLGLRPKTIENSTSVVVDVAGSTTGGFVALRADMDALPIQEETGLRFTSKVEGVMHACGHDGHISMLLGAAELLVENPPPLPVRLIFQPAEELGTGAKQMIKEGALENVKIIFGGHIDRHHKPGILVVSDGAVNASGDMFKISISGQGGHGARPHETIDAVVVGGLLVVALQTIVSREVDPAHPSVLSIGSFHAGSAPNIIAGSAVLEGTIRANDSGVRDHLQNAIKRIANSMCDLHGASVDVDFRPITPVLNNLERPTSMARSAAIQVVGQDYVKELTKVNMGGEDFAYFLDHVPGCYIRFGAQVAGRESYPAHSSQFDFDESALGIGALWFDTVARIAGKKILEE
ncbi:MAG: amidohydrolase [Bacteriovoracaceae bacterium]|jgi:amidohydrolase|nr:amidohydrolase [Bacteriovoracaceae bacterium]